MTIRLLLTVCATMATSLWADAQYPVPASNDKGKWGYVNDSGAGVINYSYDEALAFDNGLAKVRKGDNWGIINTDGKEIVPVKYNLIEKYAPAIYRVAAGGKIKDGVLLDEKYGFINTAGDVLLKPEYDEIGQFKNGLAYIKKGETYGYINDKIELIIPCRFKSVGAFNADGYVWVCDGGSNDKDNPSKVIGGKIGIYYKNGNVIIPAKYKSVGIFYPLVQRHSEDKLKDLTYVEKTIVKESGSHKLYAKYFIHPQNFTELKEEAAGFWMSGNADGTKNGVVDLNGKIIIPENKYRHAWYPTDGLSLVIINTKYKNTNFLNVTTGQMLLANNVVDAWAFNNGYAIIMDNPDTNVYHAIVDTRGNIVSNRYDEIYAQNNGVHVVRQNKMYGLIGGDGHEILPPDNYSIYPPSENLLLRRQTEKSKVGYVNLNGQWAINPQYTAAFSFKHGWAAVKSENGWGYIDANAQVRVPLKWYSVRFLSSPNPDIIFVDPDKDGGSQPYDVTTGKLLGTSRYKFIRNFGVDYKDAAIVGKDDQNTGIIDKNGNAIIPTLFPIAVTRRAYDKFINNGKQFWTETDTYRTRLLNDPSRNKGRLNQTLSSSVWDY